MEEEEEERFDVISEREQLDDPHVRPPHWALSSLVWNLSKTPIC